MHQCSASIHWERGEGGESRGWCLCDATDPIRSHGKGMEREAARRQRGIEFARLRLQDEPWIWFLCYTSICYYISGCLRVFMCLHSCMGLLHDWVCVDFWVCKGACVCVHMCLLANNLQSLLLMFACIFLSFFSRFFLLPLVWIPMGSHVQHCSKAVQIPLSLHSLPSFPLTTW